MKKKNKVLAYDLGISNSKKSKKIKIFLYWMVL